MSSRQTLWKRKKRAAELGCSVEELPDGRGRHHNGPKGSTHNKWNNNMVSKDGYKLLRVGKDHPLACPNGYAREHLVIWASVYGLASLDDKVVHHKNMDRLDNRIENLEALTVAEHNALHNAKRDRDDRGRFLPCYREWNGMPEVK